ncbi:MAG: single-stranded DNA-binding protein, partial [Ruminococcus sp.]|nr:single-stranded DNA-binding protein [Ruminococcus sp.]
MNKVILVGRLTADPEIRQSQNGTSMCRFTV